MICTTVDYVHLFKQVSRLSTPFRNANAMQTVSCLEAGGEKITNLYTTDCGKWSAVM